MFLKSKQPNIGTTIFTVMSKLATDTGAINLSQGFPSYNCAPKLIELVNKHLKLGHNQYAPMAGVPALRDILAQKTATLYGQNYDPETEITIVSGATEAIFACMTSIVELNDEVIVFEPAYDSYAPAIALNGGKPVYITLQPNNDYAIDWAEVEAKITSKTKAIIINTPHNPTGKCLTMNDLDQLAAILKDTNIFVIADEVYEHILFDGRQHCSLMMHPVLKERSFVCGSFGKTFHTTGWKIGYCLAPKELSTEFRKAHQWITFSVPTPFQFAIADYLQEPSSYLELPAFYEKKRDKFLSYLHQSRFEFTPAQGSFFQCVSYKNISQAYDFDLAVAWTKQIGVASIPVSAFYHQKNDYKMLRFCFAKDDDILEKAGQRLAML